MDTIHTKWLKIIDLFELFLCQNFPQNNYKFLILTFVSFVDNFYIICFLLFNNIWIYVLLLLKVSLNKYEGKPTLVVNVASNCGLTKNNYKQLNELYEKYEKEGLRIAAFPSNQFAGQEPACDIDIKEFAKKNNVKFDMYSKIDVNGI